MAASDVQASGLNDLFDTVFNAIAKLFRDKTRDETRIKSESVPEIPKVLESSHELLQARAAVFAAIDAESKAWMRWSQTSNINFAQLLELQGERVALATEAVGVALSAAVGVEALFVEAELIALWKVGTLSANEIIQTVKKFSEAKAPDSEGKIAEGLAYASQANSAAAAGVQAILDAIARATEGIKKGDFPGPKDVAQVAEKLGGGLAILNGILFICGSYESDLLKIITLTNEEKGTARELQNDWDSYTKTVNDGFVTLGRLQGLLAKAQQPIGEPDSRSAKEDTPLFVGAGEGVLRNDHFNTKELILIPPGMGTAETVLFPRHAEYFGLSPDGSYAYKPAQDYEGPDDFAYRVKTSSGYSAIVSVQLTVIGVDDPPVAHPDAASTPEGQSKRVSATDGVLERFTIA